MKNIIKCNLCNKPFKAYFVDGHMEDRLCRECLKKSRESRLKELTGCSVSKTMVRSEKDIESSMFRDLEVKRALAKAELEAESVGRVCRDCGKTFTITAGELSWYSSMGFSIPTRCPECRKDRKYLNGLERAKKLRGDTE